MKYHKYADAHEKLHHTGQPWLFESKWTLIEWLNFLLLFQVIVPAGCNANPNPACVSINIKIFKWQIPQFSDAWNQ